MTGIWHAAGVLSDGLLPAQTALKLALVYAPKAHGACLLRSACSSRLLVVSVLFSSVAAGLGNVGQGSYAAANATLDALALTQRASALRACSLQCARHAASPTCDHSSRRSRHCTE